MDHLDKVKLKPFVKWVGGKTQIVKKLSEIIVSYSGFSKSKNIYFEPFLGGGGVIFIFTSF